MSSNYGFEPTLDGLNNIDTDTTTATNIVCDTITVNSSSSVPTRTAGESTTNIANTTFVTNAITTAGANYVDLTSAQNITGAKSFNTVLPTSTVTGGPFPPGTLITNSYVDTVIAIERSNLLAGTNAWTGTNTFNTNLPTSTQTVTSSSQLTTKTYVDGAITTGSSNLLAGTNAWTGTNTFNTNLPTSTITPTTGNMLCNKTYVDSVAGGGTVTLGGTNAWTGTNTFNTNLPTSTQTVTSSSQLTTKTYVDGAITTGSSSLLASKNVWTNENDFTNIVKVQTPSISSFQNLDLYSADNSIVINGAPGTTSALSGVNLNTNTLTVPIKNNQSLIRIRIPMNIAGFGVPSFYFGQLDIIFNSITAITILKNGSFYKTVSVFELLNFTGTTKSWTGWTQKGENARAYVGDVRFELALTTGNTSVDTYTIGITMDVAVNAAAVGLITPRFLCSGDVNFTTTHATTSTGTTYISTDPASYFPYQINFGNSGNFIIGKGDIFLKSIDGGNINIDAWSYVEMKAQYGIDVLAGNADLNLKTLTSGDVNIQSAGATNISSGGNTSIQTNIAGGLISLKVSDGTTAIEIQDVTASAQYQKSYIVIPETSRINIIPEGTILTSVVATAPEGYVLCNGASYSSTNIASNKYRRLFDAIGYTFGGSGASYNVPNFSGAVLKSQGSQVSGGVTYSGAAIGTAQADAVQTPLTASNQGWRGAAAGTRECVSRTIIGTDPVDTTTGILPRFTRTATDNRVFTYSVYYYIKF